MNGAALYRVAKYASLFRLTGWRVLGAQGASPTQRKLENAPEALEASMFEIERAQRVHCQELNSGKYFTGFFLIDDKTISVNLFGYDAHVFLDVEKEPVFLRTNNNNFISLHSNIQVGLGTSSRRGRQRTVVHNQKIISSVAVIGPDRWSADDPVKYVTFRVEHTNSVLRHQDKTRHLSMSSLAEERAHELFEVCVAGITLRVAYGGRYSVEHDHPIETWPYIEIEFDDGIILSKYLDYVACIVQFFSASLGIYLQPSGVKICRLSQDEMMAAIKTDQFDDMHSVEYCWPEIKIEENRIWHGNSFILAYDDAELSALKECISKWVERLPEWRKAYALMMGSLSLTKEISPNRLMAAWRWFEEIPGTEMTSVIADDDVATISQQASNNAAELGYSGLQKRIAGALRRIGTETNLERFSRLVGTVRAKFGTGIFDDEILDHLERAVGFRGRVAHGHFGADSDSEFQHFARSIYAVEALSFLLTIRDLPMCEAGAKRAGGNPFVSDYRHSY